MTVTALAEKVGVARSTATNFKTGKSVEVGIFAALCGALGIDPQEVVDLHDNSEFSSSNQDGGTDSSEVSTVIEHTIRATRQEIYADIQERCGSFRVLSMNTSVELKKVYVESKTLSEIERDKGQGSQEITDLRKSLDFDNPDWLGLTKVSRGVSSYLDSVKHDSKLLISGKPGTGKTVALKRLALLCIDGEIWEDLIPVYISFEKKINGSEGLNLLETINHSLSTSRLTASQIDEILELGKALILMDGLDLLEEEDFKEIEDFSSSKHNNRFVATCRVSAHKYILTKFTEVELSDFDDEQIKVFAENWCQLENSNNSQDFLEEIEKNKTFKQLATNPLLLMHLWLWYQRTDSAPISNRPGEFCKKTIAILLREWDEQRLLTRPSIEKELSSELRLNSSSLSISVEALLGKLSLFMFEQGLFIIDRKYLIQKTSDYIKSTLNCHVDPNTIRRISENVLGLIEANYGLLVKRSESDYSFSHISIQEYLAAQEIKDNRLEEKLAKHIKHSSWREVFLFAAEISEPTADNILLAMKKEADLIIADDDRIQKFVEWASKQPVPAKFYGRESQARATYLTFVIKLASEANMADRTYDQTIELLSNSYPISTLLDDEKKIRNNLQKYLEDTFQLSNIISSQENVGTNAVSGVFSHEINKPIIAGLEFAYTYQLIVDCLNSGSVSAGLRRDLENTLLLSTHQLGQIEWLWKMKEKADKLVESDEVIQYFLRWADKQATRTVGLGRKSGDRGAYLSLVLHIACIGNENYCKASEDLLEKYPLSIDRDGLERLKLNLADNLVKDFSDRFDNPTDLTRTDNSPEVVAIKKVLGDKGNEIIENAFKFHSIYSSMMQVVETWDLNSGIRRNFESIFLLSKEELEKLKETDASVLNTSYTSSRAILRTKGS